MSEGIEDKPVVGPKSGSESPAQALPAVVIDPEAIVADWTKKLAILTGLLVFVTLASAIVSALQWWEIRRGASDANAQQRAWIASRQASIVKLALNKPLVSKVEFDNFGRNPSSANHEYRYAEINIDEWNKNKGKDQILGLMNSCHTMGRVDGEGLGLIFHDNSYFDQEDSPVADQDLIDGKKVFVRMDCFVYDFENNDMHSHSCFYFINGDPDGSTMYSCNYGFFAD